MHNGYVAGLGPTRRLVIYDTLLRDSPVPELRGVGANQTVDQVGLYGRAVRLFHEIGVPEARTGQVGYWRALVARAADRLKPSRGPGVAFA